MATTPNMNMTLPTVSVTLGPTYATQQNEALDVVDAHDHTFGKGAAIPSAALDINADLPFASNAATGLGSAQFTSQTVALTGIESALYFLDGDLYAIDGDGNAIQMTVGGVIASGIVGNISGLVAPATAAYASSTFTWKSTATTYATMVSGPLVVRRGDEASPQYVALLPPTGLASSYEMRFPAALPLTTQFLTLDASGGIAAGIATSQGITRAMQAAVGQQVSSSCGSFTTTSTSYTNVTNLSVTITTTGRPIIVGLSPVAGSVASLAMALAGDDAYGNIIVSVTGSATTTIGEMVFSADEGNSASGPWTRYWPVPTVLALYASSAGTYTLTVQMKRTAPATSVQLNNCVAYAYEL